MALLCSYTCISYYPLLDYSGYDRVCVEACIGLSYKALGRFLLGFGSSSSPEKIVSVMIGSLEESAVFSTICFSGSTIGLKCLSNAMSSSILPVFKARYFLRIESLVFAISFATFSRYFLGDRGINPLDAACREHDIA
ncbi:hypothetical protein ALC57_02404 [Trachymyrmex cornetzi]|uniref:Uncharacterized protein n=1 Tax=Trachymyrmex cornetzi TaxID=471704 RepID=A0A151JP41_9HYME|nr:hypothetical protein ALC57_02404 [Trachymyrmex cornetzi]